VVFRNPFELSVNCQPLQQFTSQYGLNLSYATNLRCKGKNTAIITSHSHFYSVLAEKNPKQRNTIKMERDK